MSAPYWISTDTPIVTSSPKPLPHQVDVLIIGAGLAGLATGMFLAEGGASVLVLEAREDAGLGVSGRQLGVVHCGLGDNALRLEAAIGVRQTGQILSFCNDNLSILKDLGALNPCGSLSIAMSDQEASEMPTVVSILKKHGLAATLWEAEHVNQTLHATGLGPACHIENTGTVNPNSLLTVLTERLVSAGGRIATNSPVETIDETPDGLCVTINKQLIQAEIVVMAAGAAIKSLDAYFHDKVYPVRTQAIAIQGSKDRFDHACEAQYGYGFWRQTPSGQVLFGGCRWATPHLEVGETDDSIVVASINHKIQAMIQRTFPDLAGQEIQQSWSGIMAFTCDGLPIIGPIPGRPRMVCCGGFNGRQYSLALKAARIVSDGLLNGSAGDTPPLFRPQRFL